VIPACPGRRPTRSCRSRTSALWRANDGFGSHRVLARRFLVLERHTLQWGSRKQAPSCGLGAPGSIQVVARSYLKPRRSSHQRSADLRHMQPTSRRGLVAQTEPISNLPLLLAPSATPRPLEPAPIARCLDARVDTWVSRRGRSRLLPYPYPAAYTSSRPRPAQSHRSAPSAMRQPIIPK